VASRGVDPDVSMNENRTHPPSLLYKGMETFSLNKEGRAHSCVNQCHLARKTQAPSLYCDSMKTMLIVQTRKKIERQVSSHITCKTFGRF